MLILPKPQRLNGARLREELAAAGVPVGADDMLVAGDEVHFLPDLSAEQGRTVATVLSSHTGEEDRTTRRRREVTEDARQAWALLNDAERWAGMTAANRNEAVRRVLRALVREAFSGRVPEVE